MDDITYNIDLAIEEMSELIQALSKHKRLLQEDKTLRLDKSQIRENIKEEIADVNIVLTKLKEMYFEYNIDMIKFIEYKVPAQTRRVLFYLSQIRLPLLQVVSKTNTSQ